MQEVVDDTASRHETGVDSPTNDTTERVPRSRVEPIPEFLRMKSQYKVVYYDVATKRTQMTRA